MLLPRSQPNISPLKIPSITLLLPPPAAAKINQNPPELHPLPAHLLLLPTTQPANPPELHPLPAHLLPLS
jgi:hypothetical protein